MKFAVLVLGSLGIAQALLVCTYLLTVKEKKTNILLALALFGLTLRIGKSLVLSYVPLDPWIRNLGISGTLLTGPFLWFYGKALFEKRDFGNNDYLHLIPFALFVLLCAIIPNRGDFVSYLTYALVLFHFALYLSGCWIYIARHLQGARLLSWYRNIIIGASSIGLLFLGIFLRIVPIYILGAVFFSFLIYIFSFLLLRRHVFALEKYSNSGIDAATSKRWLQLIKELFETKEIYLDSRISLKAVAESLSITPRQVSQVINEHEQKNFSEFVNQYRIGKAKVLLADRANAKEKIETIAFDCGFGNVTSFNLSFKAETGMTPSQYKSQFFPA